MGERLGVPVVHLDASYWRAGWTETPKEEWSREVARLVAGDAWVMDGNYSGTFDLRIPAADTIVFLDLPRLVCLWRVVKRWLRYRRRARPDMHPDCPERINRAFVAWIWNYPRRQRPRVLERLRAVAAEKRVIVLTSDREVERFVASLSRVAH
jgi:adenylate kinase family enzyme